MGGSYPWGYTPRSEPERGLKLPSLDSLVRPALVVLIVGVVLFAGFKLTNMASAASGSAASDAQLVEMGQKVDELQHRLDQMEKERKVSRAVLKPATPSPVIAEAPKPAPPKHQFTVSPLAPSAPPPLAPSLVASNSTPQIENDLNAQRDAIASTQQQWEATADRLGSVVGELDSQRDAIEHDQAKLNELSERFEQNSTDSQAFTLERSSMEERVGPIWLQLLYTDLKNQHYTMRLWVNGTMVVLKDRALNEAIQFHASGGRLSFELVVAQIGKDFVSGRLVLPQTTATP